MKRFRHFFFFVGLFCCSIHLLHAETITYSGSGLSTTSCNIFNLATAPVVNGRAHYPLAGGAYFNGTAVVLKTHGGSTNSTVLGTAYAIAFPIKKDYTYAISINAGRQSSDPVSTPQLAVGVLNALVDLSATVCNSVDQNTWGSLQSNFIGQTWVNTTSTYTLTTGFTPTTNYAYFFVLGYGGSTSNSTELLINNVTITETSPGFTLSPSTIGVTCGTTPPKTITVNNPYNIANITSYEWHLGSASNGWIYNGSAAPQNISTSTNTLTLTPTCGANLSNISLDVMVSGSVYKSYSIPVTQTAPSMTINGANSVCNSEYYSISDVPCNGSVTWSASPSGYVSLTPSGNAVTVTKLLDGPVTLTATVTPSIPGGCYSTTNVNKYISAGPPPLNIVGPYDPVSHAIMSVTCINKEYYYIVGDPVMPDPYESYTWMLSPPPTSINNPFPSFYSGSTVYLTFDVHDYFTLSVSKTNSCGTSSGQIQILPQECFSAFKVSASPNPVTNVLIVTLDDATRTTAQAKTLQSNENVLIELFHSATAHKQKQWTFKTGQKQYTLNVAGLRKGPNVLKITKGKQQQTINIIIQ
ncbi:MAG: hypothetical protein J0I41_08730 [Filimonas sp.]|nr:hypothetical protein [Filimonas sp.]